jgi:hypothetical protein
MAEDLDDTIIHASKSDCELEDKEDEVAFVIFLLNLASIIFFLLFLNQKPHTPMTSGHLRDLPRWKRF